MNSGRVRIRWRDNKYLILEFLSNGYGYVHIAKELGCDRHAVETAAYRLFQEIGAETKCHAVAIAYQRGILKIT